MIVQAYGSDGLVAATATTDTNGVYGLSLGAGQYRVLAYDNNGVYATAFANGADSFESSSPFTLTATETAKLDFALENGVTISGTVRASSYPDLSAGTPTGGLTVAVYNAGSGTRRGSTLSKTDPASLGTWSMVVPAGSYKLIAFDDFGSLGPLFYGNKLAFDNAPAVVVAAGQPMAGLDFALKPSARLIGKVADTSGNAIAGAVVYAYTADGYQVRSSTADANGQFGLILVSQACYRFVIVDPTGVFAAAFVGDGTADAFVNTQPICYSPTQYQPTFRLVRAGIIRGHTVDKNGASIPALQIAAYNPDGSLRTETKADASGAFSLSLPAGNFRLAAYDNSLVYATQFYNQTDYFAAAMPVSTVAGQITPGVDFALKRAGHFTGVVTDNYTAAPVSGMTVTAYDDAGRPISSATTNTSGLYNLAIPAGTFRLIAWDGTGTFVYANSFDAGASNFEATAPRTIASDALQAVNFTMRRAVDLVVGKVTVAGTPAIGVAVDALDLDGHHVASAISRADGSFVIPVVQGTYKLFASDPQLRYASAFYGGVSLATATVLTAPQTGSPRPPITIPLTGFSRNRAARH